MRPLEPSPAPAARPRAASASAAPAADLDALLPGLLPWLASRFDLASGRFRGEGGERDLPADLLTARGRACLRALGLLERLPHVARAKLDLERDPDRPFRPAEAGPLARSLRHALDKDAPALFAALAAHLSWDGGYTLRPREDGPGSMLAAHYLLVVARPAWFAARGRTPPALSVPLVESFIERLLATHAP